MNGQPCIRNLRLTVRRVVEAVALYPDRKELLREFSELEEDDIRQALEFAAAMLDDESECLATELLKRREALVRDVNLGIEQLERGEYVPMDIEKIKADFHNWLL
jgi:uncharacterized protein (DUF433 family)